MDSMRRREFLASFSAGLFSVFTSSKSAFGLEAEPTSGVSSGTPDDVLKALQRGNERFVSGKLSHPGRSPKEFRRLSEGQNPRAVVVGCADSRVPPEILFDQKIGDLFIVRVAGSVISGGGSVVKGSVEYAVLELKVPLVIVLGHSHCGAVKAAIHHIDNHDNVPGNIDDLVATIKPSVASVRGRSGDLLENAIRANVERGVSRLKELDLLSTPIQEGRLKVLGASYSLESGRVSFWG